MARKRTVWADGLTMAGSEAGGRALRGPAVVTGAARGIGEAIARRLAADGAREGQNERSTEVIEVAGGHGGVAAVADLRDPDELRAAVNEVVAELGGCWVLVNNAGRFLKQPLLDTDVEEWDDLHALNSRAALLPTQVVAPTMLRAGGGRIVNQATLAAKLGTAGEAAYAASQASLVALSRISAMALGVHHLPVTAVCPGYVLTEMGAGTRDPEQIATWEARSPLGRLATPADVASAVAHLASDDAAYVTGEAINVTGGMCTW